MILAPDKIRYLLGTFRFAISQLFRVDNGQLTLVPVRSSLSHADARNHKRFFPIDSITGSHVSCCDAVCGTNRLCRFNFATPIFHLPRAVFPTPTFRQLSFGQRNSKVLECKPQTSVCINMYFPSLNDISPPQFPISYSG